MYKSFMPNACGYANPFIYPNPNKVYSKAAMLKEWYVGCKFYDPSEIDKYPKGCLSREKGLAEYKTYKERLFADKILLEKMQSALDKFYNPIPSKRYFDIIHCESSFSPD